MKDITYTPKLPRTYSKNPKAGEQISADTMSHIMTPVSDAYTPELMREAFAHAEEADENAREVLFQQTHVMHYLFNRFLNKGIGSETYDGRPLPDRIKTDYMLLALRTQQQCRQTVDAMRLIDTVDKGDTGDTSDNAEDTLVAERVSERTE